MWDMPRKVNPRNVHVVFVLHECTPELSKNAFVFNGNQFYKARVPLDNHKQGTNKDGLSMQGESRVYCQKGEQ